MACTHCTEYFVSSQALKVSNRQFLWNRFSSPPVSDHWYGTELTPLLFDGVGCLCMILIENGSATLSLLNKLHLVQSTDSLSPLPQPNVSTSAEFLQSHFHNFVHFLRRLASAWPLPSSMILLAWEIEY